MNLKPDENNTLCLYPFFNVMVAASGHYKPCCKFSGHLSNKNQLLQAPQNTFNQAWQSDDMVALRNDLLAGKKPTGCKVCWDEESKGIKSMRYDSFHYGVKEQQVNNPTAPTRLDLYASNICNLRCRICSPHYSSKWIQEAKETQNIQEEIHLNLTEENFLQLKNWLPQMVEIGIFGGEPLYMKETIALLEYCVAENYSKNITLLINTNATVYSERIMQLFKKFKRVVLNFSIDDIEKRFEYQRKGADWNDAVENMKSYLQNGGSVQNGAHIECKICCTVSLFNVFYLPELLKWIDTHLPGIQVFLNMLHGPYSLSVRNLPPRVKARVIEKLKEYMPPANPLADASLRTLDDVIAFIQLKEQLPFDVCMQEIVRGDNYRKENFEDVFSEMNELIKGN